MFEEPFIEFMGVFDDDGNQIPMDSIPKPSLCILCLQDDNTEDMETIVCVLARYGHMLEDEYEEFVCHGFVPKV
jgi:hypothetical protein